MQRIFVTLLLALFLPIPNSQWVAQRGTNSQSESAAGSVVCPIGVYSGNPTDCVPLGPSERLTQLAAKGIPYPIVPLPAYSPDQSLNDSPYQYFKVTNAGANLYSSLDAAIGNQPSKILYPSNDLYVSYIGSAIPTKNGSYYYLTSGYYVYAEGGRLGKFDPPFQGLQFSSTPKNPFGWILGETESVTAPGVNSPKSGVTHYRFQVVQIYDTQDADNLTWNLIGPGEWIDSRQIARVDISATPPPGVTSSRWIQVNLAEQTVSVYENNQLIFATMASTGVQGFWTRPGLFQIQKKLTETTMSNSVPDDFYYLEDVPWTMYFDEDRAFHGAYWHNQFGYPHSHGCVNLSVGDAHWLYNWAHEGDAVYVFDPSGRTPTDPALFGSGAP
jgi:hypothetical protein